MIKVLVKAIKTKLKLKKKKPNFYNIIMLNDDFTTMEFVVSVLQNYFNMDYYKASQTMLKIHNEGNAVCGIYPKDVAETKVTEVAKIARVKGYPLRCILKQSN
jgi:ATP-dependent Clp protease adaptor protein ClpS